MKRSGIAATALYLISASSVLAQKPTASLSRDPGGIAIALLTTGITYTDPAIAACIARDGEGEMIAFDALDNDGKPWRRTTDKPLPQHGGDGDEVLRLFPCQRGVRIIPIRVDPKSPLSIGRAIEFASKTPARIVAIPMWSDHSADWVAFGSATSAFANVLVIVPAGDGNRDLDREPVFPAAFSREGPNWPALPNLAVVSAATGDAAKLEHTTNFGAKTVTVTLVDGASDRPAPVASGISLSVRATVEAAWTLACSLPKSTKPQNGESMKRQLFLLQRPTRSSDGHSLLDAGCRKQ